MVVGAVALARHGVPRFAGGLGVLVRNSPGNARRLGSALAAFGVGALGLGAADFLDSYRVIRLDVAPFLSDFLASLPGVGFDQRRRTLWSRRAGGLR